ncbi:hypothetical protein FRC09_003239 [Ceratobasidium sp. 395]|nr:hypothetical protein FRC09_003239 [Ceratobasidium sp. 395]
MQGAILADRARGIDSMALILVPTNSLGEDQARAVNKIDGLSALALHRTSLSHANNKRPRRDLYEEIEKGKYTHVFLGPEMITTTAFGQLINKKGFRARHRYFAVDEAHMLTEWRHFREDFAKILQLRNRFAPGVAWLSLSATVEPQHERQALFESFGFQEGKTEFIPLPVDRSSITYCPRFLQYSAADSQTEFFDFCFIIPRRIKSIHEIKTTLVFTTLIKTGVAIAEYLTSILPDTIPDEQRQGVVRCVHGQMSSDENTHAIEALRRGDLTRVLVCTDTGAVGIDVHGIQRVIILVDKSTTYRMLCQKAGRLRGAGVVIVLAPRWMDLNRTSQGDASLRAEVEQVMLDFLNAVKEKCPRVINGAYWGDQVAPSPLPGLPCCNRHNPEIDKDDLKEVKERAALAVAGKKRQFLRTDYSHTVPDNVVMRPIARKLIRNWRELQLPGCVGYDPHLPFSAIIPDHLVDLLTEKMHICSTRDRFAAVMASWNRLDELGDSLFNLVTDIWKLFESPDVAQQISDMQAQRKEKKVESQRTRAAEEAGEAADAHVTGAVEETASRPKKLKINRGASTHKVGGGRGRGRGRGRGNGRGRGRGKGKNSV